jgi:membrane carboxypeptidase/penicillin-binding protein
MVKRGQLDKGEQVLNPEVARAVANAIRGVVQEGTAKRVKQAFYKQDGSVIALGGKTGTGDQRFDVYGAGHRLIESRYVNRSATFVFNIGERFFGSMTAYVHGPESAHYDFTSALPVQLLVTLAPSLMPMIEKQETVLVPGLHVTTAAEKAAAAAAAGTQLSDGVATVKPAPDGAREEEAPAKSEPAKPESAKPESAKPESAKPVAAKPESAKPESAKPVAAKPAPEAAKPAPAAAYAKPAAAAAARPKAAGEDAHPKAVDVIRAKAPAKPRPEATEQPKANPAPRQKPPAVEEVLN